MNITDESFHMSDSQTMREMKREAKDIDTFNKWCIEDYILMFKDGGYLVDVETFWEYCDRNPYKFLGKLNILKGNIDLVEDLYYWWIIDENGNGTAISPDEKKDWKILWLSKSVKDKSEYLDEKILLKFIELGFIEVESTSKKKYLIEYITKHTKVTDLNNIAKKENIVIKGKKQDKILTLIEAVKSNLMKNTLIDIYKPTDRFDKWMNELQIKYVELIEEALKTFDYPDIYIASVWEVVCNSTKGDLPLIESIVKMRQKKYFDLISTVKRNNKAETKRLVSSGEHLTINCINDIHKEKIKKANVIVITDNADDLTKKLYEKIQKEIEEEEVEKFKKKEEKRRKKNNDNQGFYKYLIIFVTVVFILMVLKVFS